MSSNLHKISKIEFDEEEKKQLSKLNFNDMKTVLQNAGIIKTKKMLTKPMYQMFKLVANNASEEEKNTFILKETIEYKIFLFKKREELIYEISKFYYNFFTYEASNSFEKLFTKELGIDEFLLKLEDINSLENFGTITNIKNKSSILNIKDEVLTFFIQDSESEINSFADGYRFEEPDEEDYDDIEEYNDAIIEHNQTHEHVKKTIQLYQIKFGMYD